MTRHDRPPRSSTRGPSTSSVSNSVPMVPTSTRPASTRNSGGAVNTAVRSEK
ncbi:hypothetical protein I552_6033 [Mycobacterium xenopi 3993]|nr:hypothetical protein I552_6033 [Mycobacterium xenopi 3993]